MTIIESIAKRLNLREWQVQAVLDLFDQEATIPFIMLWPNIENT